MITNLFSQSIWFAYEHIPVPSTLCLGFVEGHGQASSIRCLARAEVWWVTEKGEFKLTTEVQWSGLSSILTSRWFWDREEVTEGEALQTIRLSDKIPPGAFMYQMTHAPVGGEEVRRMLSDFRTVFFGRHPLHRWGAGDTFLRLERLD